MRVVLKKVPNSVPPALTVQLHGPDGAPVSNVNHFTADLLELFDNLTLNVDLIDPADDPQCHESDPADVRMRERLDNYNQNPW